MFFGRFPRLEIVIFDSTSTLFPIMLAMQGEVSGLAGPFLAILPA
jgi:hypothetical protein